MRLEKQLRELFKNPKLKDVNATVIINTDQFGKDNIRLCNNPKSDVDLMINVRNAVVTCFKINDDSDRGVSITFSADGNEYNAILHVLTKWLYSNLGIELD